MRELGHRLWAGPAPLPFGDLLIVGGAFAGTGRILEWVIEELLAEEVGTSAVRRAALFEEAAALPLGADGLIARPIVNGVWQTPATASDAFHEISADHRPAHFVRAAIEGSALAVAHLLAPAREAGLTLTEMRLSGPATGAAPGPLSLSEKVPAALVQLRADLFGVPVVIGQNPEASAAGAAALAGVASGLFGGLQEAVAAIAQPAQLVEPRASHAGQAAELLARYSALMQEQGEVTGGRRED
jgi:sugar (pentulose or hexulose) kinase